MNTLFCHVENNCTLDLEFKGKYKGHKKNLLKKVLKTATSDSSATMYENQLRENKLRV